MSTIFRYLGKQLVKARGYLLLLTGLAPHLVAAQGLAPESFQNTSSANFTLGGTASLTANGTDPNGEGYLRLTKAAQYESGYAIGNNQFPATEGFSIAFEFFSYGSLDVAADGLSVFLVDADKTSASTFEAGQTGGSLGYVGVANAYLGIGLDEFGNFSNPDVLRVGGPGRYPQSIALRGAGNGYTSGFPYLGGTKTLPYSLSVAKVRAQVGSPDYRRVFINAVPQNGAFLLTVRLQHGNMIETVINELSVPAPPTNLRIGLAGSTGDNTGIHEIRKLQVVRAPLLRQDSTSTRQGQPVSMNIISNDVFPYADYAASTVDLDIVQEGIQSEVTLPNQGTLSVNSAGEVTFSPSSSFTGTLVLPYTAQDEVGQIGTPVNMKITIDAAAPLPVTLTSFSVVPQQQNALVHWTTATEKNNDHFSVKRSFDGQQYTEVATIKGQGTTNQPSTYSWVDEGVATRLAFNSLVYYIIQEVDTQGKPSNSPVRMVRFQPKNAEANLFPNPFTSSATLDLTGLSSGLYQVELFTLTGRSLATYSLAGQQTHTLDLAHLTPGAYLLRISGIGTVKTQLVYRY
jgi:hypothetical protein